MKMENVLNKHKRENTIKRKKESKTNQREKNIKLYELRVTNEKLMESNINK